MITDKLNHTHPGWFVMPPLVFSHHLALDHFTQCPADLLLGYPWSRLKPLSLQIFKLLQVQCPQVAINTLNAAEASKSLTPQASRCPPSLQATSRVKNLSHWNGLLDFLKLKICTTSKLRLLACTTSGSWAEASEEHLGCRYVYNLDFSYPLSLLTCLPSFLPPPLSPDLTGIMPKCAMLWIVVWQE